MGSEAEYATFEQKVKRTVYLDNLSPHLTKRIVKEAIAQFGTVKNVQFIPNFLESKNVRLCALVEMENPKQANGIVSDFAQKPFMIGGMPRPIRARAAKPEMFEDRPTKPGTNREFRWVQSGDTDFEAANKLKQLAKSHALEAEIVLKKQLEDEEDLANRQQETLKANNAKYEMIVGVISEGTAKCLAHHYHLKPDDY